MSDETTRTIVNYRPISLSVEVGEFTRAAVSACLSKSPGRAKALLFAVGRLGGFCSSVGLELTPEICFSSSVLERFIVVGCTEVSGPTRRTLRTNLRFVARRVLPAGAPSPVPLSRERSKAPYSDAEIAAYLALADVQPTLARRHRFGALICLDAGAGLMGNELRSVTGHDIVTRSGGVVVNLAEGRRPRVVPVLSRYHGPLADAAWFAGERYVIGGVDPQRANVTDRLV